MPKYNIELFTYELFLVYKIDCLFFEKSKLKVKYQINYFSLKK